MEAPDESKPLDILNDFLAGNQNYPFTDFTSVRVEDFKQIRPAYLIEGERQPFTTREATAKEIRTLTGEDVTFVEDWLHIPTNTLMHIAFQRYSLCGDDQWDEPVVFFGTQKHFVFALDRRGPGEESVSVIPAPKEQWDSVTDRTGHWWGRALYNDEYTDFFMRGLYRLPMHYQLLSRNDYESASGQTAEEIIAELTALGYEYVGDIVGDDGEEEKFVFQGS